MDLQAYKRFFDELPVGAYVAKPEGELIAANRAFALMLGYSSVEELKGYTGWDLYLERSDREKWLERLEKEGTVRNYEVPWRDKNGKVLWVKNSATVTRTPDGQVIHFEGVVENFTSLHDLREVHNAGMTTLRENDDLYLEVLESLPIYAVRKNKEHRFTFANRTFCQDEAKCSLEDLIGRTDFEIYPEDTARRYYVDNERVLKSGKVFESTEEHRIANGEPRFVHVIRAPIHDEKREVSGVQILFWEETDQTAAMIQLERTSYLAADYQRLVEGHFSIVYTHDLKGRFLSINKAGEETTGYSQEEFRQLLLQDIVGKEYLGRAQQYLRQKLSHGFENEVTSYEVDVVARDGRRIPLEITSRLLFRDGQPYAVEGHARDITDRKREERERLKEIHHRVKNNLQVVSSLLAGERILAADNELKTVLLRCENRVLTMAFIHKQLYEKQDLSRIDIAHYIKTLARHLVASYRRDDLVVNVKTDIDADLRLGLDTVVPCGLILNELISNALKHGFGARKRDRFDKRQAEVRIRFHSEGGDSYRLYVSDNGDGMPRDFDPRTTKSLGMRLVYGLVHEQLNGTIELNRLGGTSYNIVLKNANSPR